MLHLVPDQVKTERAVRTLPSKTDAFPDFLRPGSYRELTTTGVLGDGTLGSAEKGAEAMRRAVERIVAFLNSEGFRPADG
jgi:creatinine amidohydrolase/Fe(II)-dependent formamide hydrolase-like protein